MLKRFLDVLHQHCVFHWTHPILNSMKNDGSSGGGSKVTTVGREAVWNFRNTAFEFTTQDKA